MSKDKIDEFIKDAQAMPLRAERAKQRYSELRGRRQGELDLWHTWNENGRKDEHLEPLLKSIDPLIRSEARKRLQGLGGTMPAPALRQELRNAAVKAIHTFDPTRSERGLKGTQLTTHVVNSFQRVTDVVSAMRNPKYSPRALTDRFGTYTNAVTEFQEEHGREPTVEELQQKLPGWGPRVLKRMKKSFGAEVFSDMGGELEHDTSRPDVVQKIRNAAQLMKSTMTPQQQQFVDLHYPQPGERQMSVTGIAKHMGLPEHKVYRIKKLVEARLAPLVKSE